MLTKESESSNVVAHDRRIGVLYLTSARFLGGAVYGLRNIVRRLDRTRFRPVLALPEEARDVAEFFRHEDIALAPMSDRDAVRATVELAEARP